MPIMKITIVLVHLWPPFEVFNKKFRQSMKEKNFLFKRRISKALESPIKLGKTRTQKRNEHVRDLEATQI